MLRAEKIKLRDEAEKPYHGSFTAILSERVSI